MEEHESLLPLSASQMESLEEATAAYQAAVTPAVARYLLDRGISEEVGVTSRLGVVADPRPGHARFEGFLSIPYLAKDGHSPVSLRFRCLQDHSHRDHGHGKYMSIPGDPPRLCGVADILEADEEIHVTEGELDRLVLKRLGLPVVAIPGAQVWRPRHKHMLSGFNRIWVWGDPDDAGADLVNKITRALPRARAVRLTDGDVTETFKAGGADALLELLEERRSHEQG